MKMLLCGAVVVACMGGTLAYAADCTPKAVKVTAPSFHPETMKAGDSDALVSYRLDATGHPTAIKVADFSGDEAFAASAAKAVRDWKYDTSACMASDQEYTVRLSYLASDGDEMRGALNPSYDTSATVASTDLRELVVTSPSRDTRFRSAHDQGQPYASSKDGTPSLTFRLPE
jgi:TonB family protein